jgi:hypothetical protein
MVVAAAVKLTYLYSVVCGAECVIYFKGEDVIAVVCGRFKRC